MRAGRSGEGAAAAAGRARGRGGPHRGLVAVAPLPPAARRGPVRPQAAPPPRRARVPRGPADAGDGAPAAGLPRLGAPSGAPAPRGAGGAGAGAGARMSGASSWSFREEDATRIGALLNSLLREANARTALLVDRTGQMLATVGEEPRFDPVAFASLTAADFSANDQLARMLGENEFGALFHQGDPDSLYLCDVSRRVILVVLFDNRTTLGLVKLRVRGVVEALSALFTDMFAREAASERGMETGFVSEAEDEIDKL